MGRWTREDWTLLIRVLGVLFGGIAALSIILDHLQGIQLPSERNLGVATGLVALALVGWIAGVLFPYLWLTRVRSIFGKTTAPPESPTVDLGLARELSSAITQGIRVWNTQDQLYEESFALALSKIGDQLNGFPQEKRTVLQSDFIGQAGGVRSGWGAASSLVKYIEERLAEIAKDPMNMTLDEFIEGLTLLSSLANSGASAAYAFVQPARNANALGTSPYLAKEWNEKFVVCANALALEIRKLGDQAKALFGLDQSFYVRQVPTF